MRILILDDDRTRQEGFVTKFSKQYPGAEVIQTYTYNQCIKALDQGSKFDLVQLDHDLADFGPYPETAPIEGVIYEIPKGQKEYTGTDVALWMAQANSLTGANRPDMIVIHSWNDNGRRRMQGILTDAGFTVFIKAA